ncbi:MAG: secondary thiamine-phosphate synthase enzyme YjbQ [Intestinibacillus sp.]
MKTREYALKTGPEGMYNITPSVRDAIRESGVHSGSCIVYCPHTTAGITINENADPDVQHDMLLGLREAYPNRAVFHHMEGNSHAHLKASAMNPSQTILVENGRPVLGTWQGIYFCEFDGPRSRRYLVKVLRDPDETA